MVRRTEHSKTDVSEAAFGLKAHSGWAALVVLGRRDGGLQVLERSRLELVEEEWAKQPYHAAEDLRPAEARKVVKRGIEAAKRIALHELRIVVEHTRESGFEVRACGLVAGNPMPDWSVDEILAVHFRMHKAEGTLFRDVLAQAANACDLKLVEIPEKTLLEHCEAALGASASALSKQLAAFGKSVGAPWGKDQKDAALAAMTALQVS